MYVVRYVRERGFDGNMLKVRIVTSLKKVFLQDRHEPEYNARTSFQDNLILSSHTRLLQWKPRWCDTTLLDNERI